MELEYLWWEQKIKEGRHNYQEWKDYGGNSGGVKAACGIHWSNMLSIAWQGRGCNAAPAFCCLFGGPCSRWLQGRKNIVAQINVDCTKAETLLEAFLFVIFQG